MTSGTGPVGGPGSALSHAHISLLDRGGQDGRPRVSTLLSCVQPRRISDGGARLPVLEPRHLSSPRLTTHASGVLLREALESNSRPRASPPPNYKIILSYPPNCNPNNFLRRRAPREARANSRIGLKVQ